MRRSGIVERFCYNAALLILASCKPGKMQSIAEDDSVNYRGRKGGSDMLNIAKFQNSFKVTIQGGLKNVHKWTEEGEGEYCFTSGMEYYNGSFDVDINNIHAIGKIIVDRINKSNYSDFNEKDFSIIDNRISWNQIEDNDCNILSEEKLETEVNQYICDYDVFVSINGIELEEEELQKLLPQADF